MLVQRHSRIGGDGCWYLASCRSLPEAWPLPFRSSRRSRPSRFFGAVLLVTATFQLIHAFKVGAGPRSAWYGLSGVLYAIAGLLVIAFPLGGALTLALLLAILFIADGALRVLFAMSISAAVGRGWLVAAGCC